MPTTTTRPRPGLETWKNESKGTVFVRKLDRYGDLSDVVRVRGGGVVHLTPEERHLNQDLIAESKNDWFTNGTFTPVHILDDADDAAEISSNPHVISDDDMRKLVMDRTKGADTRFNKKLADVTNPVTLARLLEIANLPDVDAGVNRVRAIKDRIGDVTPSGGAREVDGLPVPTAGDGDVTFKPARPGMR